MHPDMLGLLRVSAANSQSSPLLLNHFIFRTFVAIQHAATYDGGGHQLTGKLRWPTRPGGKAGVSAALHRGLHVSRMRSVQQPAPSPRQGALQGRPPPLAWSGSATASASCRSRRRRITCCGPSSSAGSEQQQWYAGGGAEWAAGHAVGARGAAACGAARCALRGTGGHSCSC